MKIIRLYYFYFVLAITLLITYTVYINHNVTSKNLIDNRIRSNNRWPLAQARRNQACLILNDTILVNIGGRGVFTTEFLNLHSGDIRSVFDENLDINHHVAILHNGEIWLPCGLSNGGVNDERSIDYMRIVNIETGKVRYGPRLRHPRGGCGAALVSKMVIDKNNVQTIGNNNNNTKRIDRNRTKWVEDVICVLGGSDGQHDTGNFTSQVDCYSQLAQGWIMLPSLPVTLDHFDAHIYYRPFDDQMTSRAISTEWHEDQVLVAVGGRATNYGDEKREIYTMSLSNGSWILAAQMNQRRSAFASCIFDDRYVIVAGGIVHYNITEQKKKVLSDIEVCDMDTGKCHISEVELQKPRFATIGCSFKDVCFICGGTTRGPENLNYCESLTKDSLLEVE